MNTNLGISKTPVENELDPGFGPDTEQRRVEFASKLEEEAFSVSQQNAIKIAKANLIIALKLWNAKNLIKYVKNLKLQEIMLIWLIFEISFLSKIWIHVDNEIKETCYNSPKEFSNLMDKLQIPLSDDIKNTFNKIVLNRKEIIETRLEYGGDLVFSIKYKNKNELMKVYEFIFSKLSKSLRRNIYGMIVGVEISYQDVSKKLKKYSEETPLKLIMDMVNKSIKENHILEDDKKLSILKKIIKKFDIEASKMLLNYFVEENDKSKKYINKKVKKYYGIE